MYKRVTTRMYADEKNAFLRSHEDWKVETSSMDAYGVYRKTYMCSNGDTWYEVNGPCWEKAEAEVVLNGVNVKLEKDVKFLRTEGWSNKSSDTFVCFELF